MTHDLSLQQQAVRDWVLTGRGSLNLIARAGTGKTHTVVQVIVPAIVEGGLGEVALMAYNKNAADEFKDRLAQRAKDTGDARLTNFKHVDAGTFHSFGFRAVRKWAPGVKVDEKKVSNICGAFAAAFDPSPHEMPAPAARRVNVYRDAVFPICRLVSLAKQAAIGFLTGIEDRRTWYDLVEHHAIDDDLDDGTTIDQLIEAAIRVLKESITRDREVVDFDDMIYAPLVHRLRFWPKDWVLIDEAQDTNPARRALALAMLRPRTGRLVAVGDDRQAIYGFTGADADALDLIAAELGSATLPLTVTYRCPKAVVVEANRLVPDLRAHESAPNGTVRVCAALRTIEIDVDTYEYKKRDTPMAWFEHERPGPTDAVLCRNTKPLVELAYAMLAAGIGCRVEGREVGENLIALATRWKRVKTLAALETKLEEHRDREVQKWSAKGREDRAQAVEDRVEALLTIARSLRAAGKADVADLADWIRALFGDTHDGEVPNVVTLSTIHKSKGREWDRVFLLYRSTTLPSKWARKPWQLRQEENLEYVAITRAKRELVYVD